MLQICPTPNIAFLLITIFTPTHQTKPQTSHLRLSLSLLHQTNTKQYSMTMFLSSFAVGSAALSVFLGYPSTLFYFITLPSSSSASVASNPSQHSLTSSSILLSSVNSLNKPIIASINLPFVSVWMSRGVCFKSLELRSAKI